MRGIVLATLSISLVLSSISKAAITSLYSSPGVTGCARNAILEANGGPIHYFIVDDTQGNYVSIVDASTFAEVAHWQTAPTCIAYNRVFRLPDIDGNGTDEILVELHTGVTTYGNVLDQVAIWDLNLGPATPLAQWGDGCNSYTIQYVGATMGSTDLKLALEHDFFGQTFACGLGSWSQLLVYSLGVPVTASPPGNGSAGQFELLQNRPNPFTSYTVIEYQLERPAETLLLRILDVAGRVLRQESMVMNQPGRHVYQWDGKDDAGNRVPTGTYFYEVKADGVGQARRMLLLR
jgi:hypothetical protein